MNTESLKHLCKQKIPHGKLQFILDSDLGHSELARMFGVSRQRIHALRKKNNVKGFHQNGSGKR